MKTKNLLTVLCLFIPLCLTPWACNRPPIGPIPAATPTPTATSTPTPETVCVYASPTATPASSWGGTTLAPPTGTPTPYTPIDPFIIQNLTEWQAVFGTNTAPPSNVNFSTQMIVGSEMNKICGIGPDLAAVCEGSSGVTAWVTNPIAVPPCYTDTGVIEMLVVPQSSLPVYWYYE